MEKTGVEWSYESEGYDLDGVRYLPDFYLPKEECWLEVKGARPEWQSPDREKAKRLAHASGKPVFIISGELGLDYVIDAYVPDHILSFGKWRWCVCLRCRSAGITRGGNGANLKCGCFSDDEFYVSDNWAVIRDALLAARQERFGT